MRLSVDTTRDKRYEKVPQRFVNDLEKFVNCGVIHNKMLRFILENDLRSVCRRHRGDLTIGQIEAISLMCYNQVPGLFYGDEESVNHCRDVGGAIGSDKFPQITDD